MTTIKGLRRAVVLVGAMTATWVTGAVADARDYEFRLVAPQFKQGDGAVIAVKLVHKPTGRAVPDAVIYATRLDMSPDNMATMTAPLEPLPSTEPGVYRFRTNLTMAGGWMLSLAAKVQGETGTIENKLVFKAVP